MEPHSLIKNVKSKRIQKIDLLHISYKKYADL